MTRPLRLARHLLARVVAPLAALAAVSGAAKPAAVDTAATRGIAPANDLAAASDEFTSSASLRKWKRFHETEGWPDMIRRLEVRPAGGGQLYLEPYTSGWYADFHAPFLYQDIAGDFVVTARVDAAAIAGGVPKADWSLAGLMVRAPRAGGQAAWTPNGENWLFITAGVAEDVSQPVLETKTTVDSRSTLRLHPVRAGWVELRITRVGPAFELASRHDGEAWVVRARFDRPDLPASVQVGLNAYTDWSHAAELRRDPRRFNTTVIRDGAPDLGLRVDWIRFARP